MTDDFQRGLLTGLTIQPLSVTTEKVPEVDDKDNWDKYNIIFDNHNFLSDTGVLATGDWGNYTVTGNTVVLNFNANIDGSSWYAISNEIPIGPNHPYKISVSHNHFYGRFGLSLYGPGNAIEDHKYRNCVCAYRHNDTHALTNANNGGIKSTIFCPIPLTADIYANQPLRIMWCPDNLYDGSRNQFTIKLHLCKGRVKTE